MIRVLVLAPTPVARAGWRALLASDPAGEVQVVGEAGSSADLATQVAELRPDLVLLDPAPGDERLLELLPRLTREQPGLRVVLLGPGGEAAAAEALSAGARAARR